MKNNITNINEISNIIKQMAKLLKCNRSTYSMWEISKNIIPISYLNRISNIFNINIDYIVGLSDKKDINFNPKEINYTILGQNIKTARLNSNLTQQKLADKLNTTSSVISDYENGKIKISTLFLIEIAKNTNKSLNWLLGKTK